MDSKRLLRNARRYSVIAAIFVGSIGAYYGVVGASFIGLFLIPGMFVSTLVVGLIPPTWPMLAARSSAVLASTFVSYLAIGLGQTAAGRASVPPEISPWSPTYLGTFIGLLVGFVFGWMAILEPQPRGEREIQGRPE